MSQYWLLIVYSALVILLSMSGAWIPFLGKVTHTRLQMYLSLSAGVMLGAAFFHVMPDAFESCETSGGGHFTFGMWMSASVVGLFFIERFIAPHSHEVDNGVQDTNPQAAHNHGCEHHHHEHEHRHEPTAAAPAVAGWMAVLGLTIHTFINGVGLAAAVAEEQVMLAVPGFAMFLAIVCHKPFDALAISTVLTRKGVSRQKIFLVQLGFAVMVPAGVIAFVLTQGAIREDLESQLIGAALAVSAGTFLFIALSDLLPEVQFHRHDRVLLFLALIAGVVLMALIARLEPHEHHHGGAGHDHAGEMHEHGEHPGEDKHDHDHGHENHDH